MQLGRAALSRVARICFARDPARWANAGCADAADEGRAIAAGRGNSRAPTEERERFPPWTAEGAGSKAGGAGLSAPVCPFRFCGRSSSIEITMPLLDVQNQLGINLDKWMLYQSSKQPFKQPSTCHTFEKEWLECSDGIGMTRAKQECRLEFEDLEECMTRSKTLKRMRAILNQRKKMIKEGKYEPPNYQSDKSEVD